MFFSKPRCAQVQAQGTIEYLVIIAVVVVVALVVVGLLISLSSPGAQVAQVAGKLNAEVQTMSVLQAIAGSDGNGVLVIKNSSGDGITITRITIGDSNQDLTAYFAQGDSRALQLNKLPSCTPGVTKTYSIKINYTSSTGLAKTQTIDNVSIGCETTAITQNPVNILPDTAPPTITLSSPTPGFTTTLAQIDFNFIVSDQNTIRDCNLIIDGIVNGAGMSSPAKDTTLTFTRSGLGYTAHTWDINCADATGNRATSGQARTFYPMAAPVVYLSSPLVNASSTQTGMDFNFSVSDADGNVNSCSFILDGSVISTILNPAKDTNLTVTRFGLTVGAHTWDVNCTDANANLGASNQTRLLNMASQASLAKKVIASNSVAGAGIYVDSYGNIIVAGEITNGAAISNYNITFDSANWDTNVNGQISRGYVAKLNSDGNLVWVQKAGNSRNAYYGKKLGMDLNGNIYFAGMIDDLNNWFGSIRVDANASAAFSRDIFVSKMDSNGNWLWVKRAGAYNKSERLNSIITDSQGNSYVAGQYYAGTSFGNIIPDANGTTMPEAFVAKLDKDGNWLWVQKSNGSGSESFDDLAFGPDGNLYVCGFFNTSGVMLGNNRFDMNGSGLNVLIAKVGLDGNWIWAKKVDGNGYDVCYGGINSGSDGNLYISGYFDQSIWFGNLPRLDTNGQYDDYVAKMTPDGNWLWAVRGGGTSWDYPNGTAIDSNNNIYLTGEISSGAAYFGNYRVDGNNDDIFVAKLNKDGMWVGAKRAGSSGSSEMGNSIALDLRGLPYITGAFNNSAIFDTNQLDSNLSYYGAFIWKTNIVS